MSLTVRRLEAADNAALLVLGKAVGTAGGGFEVDRAPDFFALGRSQGESLYFGAFAGGALVGAVGVTRQKRFVSGRERLVDYVHDLRVARSHRGPVVLRRLSEAVRTCCAERAGWAFGTVLDSNGEGASLQHGRRLFGGSRVLGRTIHAGFSLSVARGRSGTHVRRLDATSAWAFYEQLASRRTLAPADRAQFEACGANESPSSDATFLGVEDGSHLFAVAKLVDQSPLRRILLNGSELRIGYLAYFVAEAGAFGLESLLGAVGELAGERFSHVFVGLSETDAKALRTPPDARLSSTTIGFGNVPGRIDLGFHELTLI